MQVVICEALLEVDGRDGLWAVPCRHQISVNPDADLGFGAFTPLFRSR